MFVHPRLNTVAVFTPSALPDFFARPTAIPYQLSFVALLLTVVAAYSVPFQPQAKNCLAAWFVPTHRVLLDAVCDPDAVSKYLSLASLLLLPASFSKALARTNLLYNGADYQIQRLTLHLAASVQLRVSPAPLAAEFPLLSLSIDSRVPSCRIVTSEPLRRTYKMVDYSFLEGIPTPLSLGTISRFTENERLSSPSLLRYRTDASAPSNLPT